MIRIITVGIAVLAQIFLLAFLVINLRQKSVYLYFVVEIFGLIGVLILVNKKSNSTYVIAWITIIILLPVFGYLLYILWGQSGTQALRSKKIRRILSNRRIWLKRDSEIQLEFQQYYPIRKRISEYLEKEGFPLYKHTESKYYELGELQFKDMIEDMKNAKKFIFLEYFIVSEGKLWNHIYEILKVKAAQGVEVRLLYDDFGSIMTAPNNIVKELRSKNIKAIPFNQLHKNIYRLYINYRNHQKIAVIDGNIGYTGGTNLADEYANLYNKYGHWKDTAIRIKGDAVWSLTVTFLQMWETESKIKENYLKYEPTVKIIGDGFYQPFSDGPVNNPHNPAEVMYRQIIYNAKEYVYITTPYLVIDDSMMDALCLTAMGGVDVRIVTPRIWDKWYVHMVTRSNYGKLIKAGVRIYEYNPGYIHAKTIISDDDNAITGSINMDYRSFNLHFENGVWICGASVLKDMKKDIMETFEVGKEMSFNEWKHRPWYIKVLQALLRLFAPLL
jgi:cardiolipin synthase